MAVSGGKRPDDLPGVDGITHTGPQGVDGVESVESADAAPSAEGVEATQRAQGASAVDSVVADLAAGRIDAAAARARLVDEAVAAQVGPGADPALIAEIRAQVEALLDNDPTLAALLSPNA